MVCACFCVNSPAIIVISIIVYFYHGQECIIAQLLIYYADIHGHILYYLVLYICQCYLLMCCYFYCAVPSKHCYRPLACCYIYRLCGQIANRLAVVLIDVLTLRMLSTMPSFLFATMDQGECSFDDISVML